MNPMYKAQIFAVIRWAMAGLGWTGVELGDPQLNTLIDAALIALPLVWSLVQKWRVNRKIQEARAGV